MGVQHTTSNVRLERVLRHLQAEECLWNHEASSRMSLLLAFACMRRLQLVTDGVHVGCIYCLGPGGRTS